MRIKSKGILAIGAAMLLASCSGATDRFASKRTKDQKPAEDPGMNFTNAAADGRPVQYATVNETRRSQVDYTKLHPETRTYFGLSADNIKIVNEAADFKRLVDYTNVQESIPESDFVAAAQRACREEFPSLTIKACMDEVIKRSGAVVFKLTTPLASPTNLNDPNHILEVAYGTLGVIPVITQTAAGPRNDFMTGCVSCHSSIKTSIGHDGQRMMHVDARGQWSGGDPGREFDTAMSYITRGKSVLSNPSDPIWSVSSRARAAGLLADQYERLRGIHGATFYATDQHLIEYSRHGDIDRAVNSGWLIAMMSWGTSARNGCGFLNMEEPNCDISLSDAAIARTTERANLSLFLPGGDRYNISNAILANGPYNLLPLRQQRNSLDQNYTFGSTTVRGINPSFALPYLDWSNTGGLYATNASQYLMAATSVALLMPASIDLDLARKWYGPSATSVSGRAQIDANIPRTVIRGLGRSSPDYHWSRGKSALPVDANFAPRMTQAELNAAQNYVNNTCYSCHSQVRYDLSATSLEKACGSSYSCELLYTNGNFSSNGTDWFGIDTPSAMFADRVFKEFNGSLVESMNGIVGLTTNSHIQAQPARVPLYGRASLTDWSALSFTEALRTNPPAPRFAVLAPVENSIGEVQVRSMTLNFDLDGNGVIGTERLMCGKQQSFTIAGVVYGCRDAIRAVSGYTPRLLGESEQVAIHASLARPATFGTPEEVVQRYLHGLAQRRVVVTGFPARDVILKYEMKPGDCGDGTGTTRGVDGDCGGDPTGGGTNEGSSTGGGSSGGDSGGGGSGGDGFGEF
jgi:hypothetical protein